MGHSCCLQNSGRRGGGGGAGGRAASSQVGPLELSAVLAGALGFLPPPPKVAQRCPFTSQASCSAAPACRLLPAGRPVAPVRSSMRPTRHTPAMLSFLMNAAQATSRHRIVRPLPAAQRSDARQEAGGMSAAQCMQRAEPLPPLPSVCVMRSCAVKRTVKPKGKGAPCRHSLR